MQAGPHPGRARREGRERQAAPDWEVAGLIPKTYRRGLSWAPLEEEISRPAGQDLKSSYPMNPGITRFLRHAVESLNTPMLSQCCILENGSGYGNSGQKVHSKDRGGGKNLLLPRLGSWVNQRSRPRDDLLQHCPITLK